MGSTSFVRLLRKSLFEVCKIPWEICLRYTGHTLRVGSNNLARQTPGLSEDITRELGGWASLPSKRGDAQLSVAEQLCTTDRLSFEVPVCL